MRRRILFEAEAFEEEVVTNKVKFKNNIDNQQLEFAK